MIDDGIARMRAFLIKNRDELKSWMSFSLDVAKMFAILAKPIGLGILISYLHNVNTPLPISDFATAQTLIIMAAVYSFIAIFLATFIFSPILMCSISRRLRRHIRVRAFDYSLKGRALIERLGSQPFLFQGSALMAMPTYSILWMSRASTDLSMLWLGIMLLVGGAISREIFLRKGIVLPKAQRFRTTLGRRVFADSVWRGGWCIAWIKVMASLYFAFPFVQHSQGSSVDRIATWSIFLIFTTGLYLTLTSVEARFERFPFVILSLVFIGLVVDPIFLVKGPFIF